MKLQSKDKQLSFSIVLTWNWLCVATVVTVVFMPLLATGARMGVDKILVWIFSLILCMHFSRKHTTRYFPHHVIVILWDTRIHFFSFFYTLCMLITALDIMHRDHRLLSSHLPFFTAHFTIPFPLSSCIILPFFTFRVIFAIGSKQMMTMGWFFWHVSIHTSLWLHHVQPCVLSLNVIPISSTFDMQCTLALRKKAI